jgi:hypothetical protein
VRRQGIIDVIYSREAAVQCEYDTPPHHSRTSGRRDTRKTKLWVRHLFNEAVKDGGSLKQESITVCSEANHRASAPGTIFVHTRSA